MGLYSGNCGTIFCLRALKVLFARLHIGSFAKFFYDKCTLVQSYWMLAFEQVCDSVVVIEKRGNIQILLFCVGQQRKYDGQKTKQKLVVKKCCLARL